METLIAPPGLKGLIVADTTVGSVRGEEGFFHYRQHDATKIARNQTFEAAAALLIDGELPDRPGESAFRAELASNRHLSPSTVRALAAIAPEVDGALTGLRAASALIVDDTPTIDLSPEERRARVLRVVGATPTILANLYRLKNGASPLDADPSLGHAADYVRSTCC